MTPKYKVGQVGIYKIAPEETYKTNAVCTQPLPDQVGKRFTIARIDDLYSTGKCYWIYRHGDKEGSPIQHVYHVDEMVIRDPKESTIPWI